MKTVRVRKFDVADYLSTDEEVAAYLEAVISEGDGQLLAAALGDVARARGMSRLARNTGLAWEALYRALSRRGNPELATLNKVLRAMGLRLSVRAADSSAA